MLGFLTKLSAQEKIITSSKQQLCKLRGENLNLKSRISKLEEKLSSIDESLENSSNYVQDQKQSQHHPTSTHLNSFQTQSESRLIVNNETENVQSCNNNFSTKDPVASEFFTGRLLREENLNLKSRISKLEEKLSSIDESLENSSNYVQDKKQSQHHPTELTGNLPLTDLPKRPRCTADRNGGTEKRINNNYKPSTVGCESRSLTNCPEQRQISTITIEPIPTTITKSNPVFPRLVHKLNLPLIESPKSIDDIKTPFWQGRLSHPTRHRTNSQARMKRSVNGTYQRMKTTTNEWERYLRYVSQTIKY